MSSQVDKATIAASDLRAVVVEAQAQAKQGYAATRKPGVIWTYACSVNLVARRLRGSRQQMGQVQFLQGSDQRVSRGI